MYFMLNFMHVGMYLQTYVLIIIWLVYFIIHACNHQSTESYVSSHPINIHPSCLAPVRYAHLKGIGDFTPQSFRSAEEAKYPCILKPKLGTFGKDTHVCRSMDEVKRFTQYGLEKWSLQELVPGRLEYSTTLLVLEGQVVDYVNTLYESIELVWKIRILLVYFTFLFWAKRMNILIAGENCVKLKISDSHPEPAFDPIDCGCGIFSKI